MPRGHRAPLGQFRILNDFSGVVESLLSSHDRPCVASRKHLSLQVSCDICSHQLSTHPPRRRSCRRHTLSAHLDSSHRGMRRRHFTSRLASREPSLRLLKPSVMFSDCPSWASLRPSAFCKSCGVSFWPSTILRLCPVLSINPPARSLFLPCHPWSHAALHALHSGLCTFCLLD